MDAVRVAADSLASLDMVAKLNSVCVVVVGQRQHAAPGARHRPGRLERRAARALAGCGSGEGRVEASGLRAAPGEGGTWGLVWGED